MKIRDEFAEEVKKRWDKLEEEAGDKYFQFIKEALKKSRIKQKSKLKGIVDCNILEISIGAIITAIIVLILHALKVI
jgi:mRNA-degrading endonuclease RelE of RelBE toxin-antitoxin system